MDDFNLYPVDVCDETGHSCACTEFSLFDKVYRVFYWRAVRCNQEGFEGLFDNVHLCLYSCGEGKGFDFAWRPFFAVFREFDRVEAKQVCVGRLLLRTARGQCREFFVLCQELTGAGLVVMADKVPGHCRYDFWQL